MSESKNRWGVTSSAGERMQIARQRWPPAPPWRGVKRDPNLCRDVSQKLPAGTEHSTHSPLFLPNYLKYLHGFDFLRLNLGRLSEQKPRQRRSTVGSEILLDVAFMTVSFFHKHLAETHLGAAVGEFHR